MDNSTRNDIELSFLQKNNKLCTEIYHYTYFKEYKNCMDNFWKECLRHFNQVLTPQQFNTWIKPLAIEQADGGIRIIAPNRFVLQWIKDRFLTQIEETAATFFQPAPTITFTVCNTLNGIKTNSTDTRLTVSVPNATKKDSAHTIKKDSSKLNPNFTFSNYVSGKANQLARAAAIQVAENSGNAYNPLFIYGGVGLGKTHLVQAIGNLVRDLNPSAKISYIHAERYVSDVVKAYQHKSFDEFKRHYHSLDLLLIDDIQFFGGKTRTQEEFFYAFNALIETKKQVVITCDSYPKEINGIDERLVSRFGWGLTVAIEPPELEMRVAILLKKAELEKLALTEDVAFFVAKQIRSNVRELEGALKRVQAFTRFHNVGISLDVAKEALKDLLAVQNRQISVENIQKTVADYYKIKVAEMFSPKRTRLVARPRQIAMALSKELTELSLPDIGDAFGGRDHTTVLHACRKIEELKNQDSTIHRDYQFLLQVLKN